MQIDEFDGKLLEILGNRMKVADKIGLLKKEKNVAILQNQRWNEILGKMILEGEEKGLSNEFAGGGIRSLGMEDYVPPDGESSVNTPNSLNESEKRSILDLFKP